MAIKLLVQMFGKGADKIVKDMNDVGDAAKKAGDDVEKTGKKAAKAGDEGSSRWLEFYAKFSLVSQGLSRVRQAFDAILKPVADFEYRMRQISTISPEVEQNFRGVSKSILELQAQSGIAGAELAKGLYEIFAAGVDDVPQALKVMQSAVNLSIGGAAELERTVSGLTKVLLLFRGEALTAGQAADVIFKSAAMAAFNVEEFTANFAAASSIAAQAGSNFAEVAAAFTVTSFQTKNARESATALKATFMALMNQNETMKEALRAVGIEDVRLAIATKGLDGVLNDLIRSLGGSKKALVEALGSIEALPAVFAIAGDSTEKFRETLGKTQEAMTAGGAIAERATGIMQETFTQTMRRLGGSMMGIVTVIAGGIGSLLSGPLQMLADAMQRISDLFASFAADSEKARAAIWELGKISISVAIGGLLVFSGALKTMAANVFLGSIAVPTLNATLLALLGTMKGIAITVAVMCAKLLLVVAVAVGVYFAIQNLSAGLVYLTAVVFDVVSGLLEIGKAMAIVIGGASRHGEVVAFFNKWEAKIDSASAKMKGWAMENSANFGDTIDKMRDWASGTDEVTKANKKAEEAAKAAAAAVQKSMGGDPNIAEVGNPADVLEKLAQMRKSVLPQLKREIETVGKEGKALVLAQDAARRIELDQVKDYLNARKMLIGKRAEDVAEIEAAMDRLKKLELAKWEKQHVQDVANAWAQLYKLVGDNAGSRRAQVEKDIAEYRKLADTIGLDEKRRAEDIYAIREKAARDEYAVREDALGKLGKLEENRINEFRASHGKELAEWEKLLRDKTITQEEFVRATVALQRKANEELQKIGIDKGKKEAALTGNVMQAAMLKAKEATLELGKAFEKVSDPKRFRQFAMGSAKIIQTFIADAKEGFKTLHDQKIIDDNQYAQALANVRDAAIQNFDGLMGKLREMREEMKAALGDDLSGVADDTSQAFQSLQDTIGETGRSTMRLLDDLQNAQDEAADSYGRSVDKVVDKTQEIMTAVTRGMSNVIPILLKSIINTNEMRSIARDSATAFTDDIASAFESIGGNVGTMMKKFGQAAGSGIKTVIYTALSNMNIWAMLIQFFNKDEKEFREEIANSLNDILKLPERFVENIPTLIASVLAYLPQMVGNIIENLPEMFSNIWTGLLTGILNFVNNIGRVFTGKFLQTFLEGLLRAIRQFAQTLGETLTYVLGGAVMKCIELLAYLWDKSIGRLFGSNLQAKVKSAESKMLGHLSRDPRTYSRTQGWIISEGEMNRAERKSQREEQQARFERVGGSEFRIKDYEGPTSNKLEETMSLVGEQFDNEAESFSNELEDAGSGMWASFGDSIVNFFKSVPETLLDWGKKIFQGFKDAGDAAFDWIGKVGSWIWDGFTDAGEDSLDWFGDRGEDLWKGFIKPVGKWFGDRGMDLWNAFVAGVASAGGWFFARGAELWKGLVNAVLGAGGWFLARGAEIWNGLVNAVVAAPGWFMARGAEIWNGLVNGLALVPGWFVARGGEIWNGFLSLASGAVTFFSSLGSSIWNGLKSALDVGNWAQWGSRLFEGVSFAGIGTGLSNAFKGAVDYLGRLLSALNPISLVSKIFDWGNPWGKGTVEGWTGIDLPFLKFATGGRVPGSASGGDSESNDKVPALLSPGELVIPRSIALAPEYRDLLSAVMSGQPIVRAAKGFWDKAGDVGSSVWNGATGAASDLGGTAKDVYNWLKGIGSDVNWGKMIIEPHKEATRAFSGAAKGWLKPQMLSVLRSAIGMAAGGLVPGQAAFAGDTLLNDKILALLSPGEFVLPRTAVQDPELIQRLISSGAIAPRPLAFGGAVEAPSTSVAAMAPSAPAQNITLEIRIEAGAQVTEQTIRREMVPKIVDELKRLSQNGTQILSKRGVY